MQSRPSRLLSHLRHEISARCAERRLGSHRGSVPVFEMVDVLGCLGTRSDPSVPSRLERNRIETRPALLTEIQRQFARRVSVRYERRL
ncbi:hypothetical protein AVEN_34103-1 [Araneus ventricosus]|uniref:Uncharacterized protein n=1 Tax=Araneus ventricosus TaxID=182803 RepID=A0A4Y2W8X3_ARAVE|nr:hypothetical protein AVEN_34103-1 [Araneus ventricosus]